MERWTYLSGQFGQVDHVLPCFKSSILYFLDYMNEIEGYVVNSNEYSGPPSPILQVFDQYNQDLEWGQDAAHYAAAMSGDGRHVVHVQIGFKYRGFKITNSAELNRGSDYLKRKQNLICDEDFFGSLWHHPGYIDPSYWKTCDFTFFVWCPYEKARKNIQVRDTRTKYLTLVRVIAILYTVYPC